MGVCCSCFQNTSSDYSNSEKLRTYGSPTIEPSTAKDEEARLKAKEAAEAREAKFNASAGGKAARIAVANLAKGKEQDNNFEANQQILDNWLR